MDNQNPQPPIPNPAINPQPTVVSPNPAVVPPHPVTAAANPNKPTLNISDDAAKALLSINGLQARPHTKIKLPVKLVVVIVAFVAFVIVVSYLLGTIKPGGSSTTSSKSGVGIPSQSNANSSSGVSNQINQDVNSCSNLVTAATVC